MARLWAGSFSKIKIILDVLPTKRVKTLIQGPSENIFCTVSLFPTTKKRQPKLYRIGNRQYSIGLGLCAAVVMSLSFTAPSEAGRREKYSHN